ncbi:hypothetical protein IM538_21645 [Cytobacillus suaedae]|nr:hypothetical protein IM538_21645 [Cytobacillus suaedae]
MKEKPFNYVVYLITIFTIITIIFSMKIGAKQEEEFLKDYQDYQTAIFHLSNNEFDKSNVLFEDLLKTHYKNYNVLKDYGLSLALSGKYSDSVTYYQKALDQRNALVRDPLFLAQFGEILYWNKDYNKSLIFLNESLRYTSDKNQIEVIKNLIKTVQQELNQTKQ